MMDTRIKTKKMQANVNESPDKQWEYFRSLANDGCKTDGCMKFYVNFDESPEINERLR